MLEEDNLEKLSNEELLEFILPKNVAVNLIKEYQGLYNVIVNSSHKELTKIKGVGRCKARKIKCISELIQRINKEKIQQVDSINKPPDVLACMKDMLYLQQEEFRVIMLNNSNGIIGIKTITKGTVNASLVSPRELFAPVIKAFSSNIIIVHNHPGGSLEPSLNDLEITKVLVAAGKIIDIKILDHIIIAKEKYFSMKEAGYI